MLVKIHESYRKLIAICDSELLGKKLEEGIMQLQVEEPFFGGNKINEKQAIELMIDAMKDDSTFNLAGKKTIAAALKAKIIDKEGIKEIEGVPFALVLL